ncbi:MAG: hypothetical protein Kow00129_13700 [Thermoleophilia bacterium]
MGRNLIPPTSCASPVLMKPSASWRGCEGVSLKIVQETLGHSTYQITADIYAHVAPELKQVAANAIDEALGGAA